MKFTKLKSFILAGAILLILPMFTQAFAAVSFSDLDKAEWAKETIIEWADKGLISGYEDGTFRPNQDITRAEYTKLMFNAYGLETEGKKDFPDVSENDWHFDVVTKMAYLKYVSGYPDGTFRPDEPITRAEAATILFNVLNLTEHEEAADIFFDANLIPGWAKGIIGAAYQAGVIQGYPDGTFRAEDNITRAESVFMINSSEQIIFEHLESVVSKMKSQVIPILTTDLQIESANVIVNSIQKYLADTDYDISGDVSVAKDLGSQMSDEEKQAFKNAITSNILFEELVALNNKFQLFEY